MNRLFVTVFAAFSLLGSMLLAAPAQAAPSVVIKSKHVAIFSNTTGKVLLQCRTKKDCKGKIWAAGHSADARTFKVKGKKSAYVTIKVSKWKDIPENSRGFRPVRIHASGATAVSATLEPRKAATISGTVQALGGPTITDLEVRAFKVGKRNRLVEAGKAKPASDGSYRIVIPTGTNNSATAKYRLQIVGKQGSIRRSWWRRGTHDNFTGGAAHSAQASYVAVGRNSMEQFSYRADFRFSGISGTVTKGGSPVASRDVTVYVRPVTWPRSGAGMRELDVVSCADVLGRVKTNSAGVYNLGFVPVTTNKVYIVKSDLSWWNDDKGTCHAAVGYRSASHGASTPGLLSVGAGSTVKNVNENRQGTSLKINVSGYQGKSSTADVDKWVTIREYAPGRKILSSDVVYQGSSRTRTLGEGKYWVETGRRIGCAAWYKSRYKDNSGYLNGLDRGAEAWRARNYKMYRDHCRAYTTGTYKLISVSGSGTVTTALANKKGATVKGRVSASKKKRQTEVLVRLTSTDGKKVYRTALTNSKGNFSVTGLAPGKYKIQVNADSWRGISRTFSGKKTITVKAGRTHSVGTLRFKEQPKYVEPN